MGGPAAHVNRCFPLFSFFSELVPSKRVGGGGGGWARLAVVPLLRRTTYQQGGGPFNHRHRIRSDSGPISVTESVSEYFLTLPGGPKRAPLCPNGYMPQKFLQKIYRLT